MTLRVISYGGGVQSTALVVLAATGDKRLLEALGGPVDAALFCNVGDDSEDPRTLVWVREVVQPWAAERGFAVHEIHRRRRDGTPETLMEQLTRPGSRSLPIPVRMSNGAPGTRSCTVDFKIKVLQRWLRDAGVTADDPAEVCIGISTDEVERAGRGKDTRLERRRYPLVDMGLDRSACQAINVATFGRPAPSSSCFFCPYHTRQAWAEQRRDRPELFEQSVELEATLNCRRAELGKDPVWLTRYNRPLGEAIAAAQDTLPGFEGVGEDGCDEGVCFV